MAMQPSYIMRKLTVHTKIDPLITHEMSSLTVHFMGFSDHCFPRSGLPGKYLRDNETPDQVLEQIMKCLCAAKLYDESEKVWTPQVRGHEMSKEQSIVSFFNQILWESAIGDSGQYVWLVHDSWMCKGRRKPDIILIPQSYKTVKDVPFSAMLSYCECKYDYTQKVGMKALHQHRGDFLQVLKEQMVLVIHPTHGSASNPDEPDRQFLELWYRIEDK
ncbi:hypothetical protein EDC04DRAFT_2606924 [Pisolithus marmoratus]|nr:hypothetical protein EDC04DRAFT_2606924 [Pisolithus marmoratus]